MLFEYAKGAKKMKAGQLIQDGSAVWIVDDVRDGARVGDIILRPTLRDGFIKANGATVKASEYPRLLAWVQESGMAVTAEQYAQDCSKYVYDKAQDKLTLPNVTGRVLMGGEQVKSVEAGLPNITGTVNYAASDLHNSMTCSGAFSKEGNAPAYYHNGNQGNVQNITIDASKYNPIYGASTTVQPPAIALIAQIKY